MTVVRALRFATVKTIAVLLLGGTVLWQVGAHSGPPNGTAYVHVTAPQVDVTVDNETYHIETLAASPIVCELRPGKHGLRMTRNGRTLYEEKFILRPGEELVLTAWDRPEDAPVESVSHYSLRP
jgi:hypothetical protein